MTESLLVPPFFLLMKKVPKNEIIVFFFYYYVKVYLEDSFINFFKMNKKEGKLSSCS